MVKKVSFLVAFLAFLQLASGTRTFAQQRLSDDARRTVEEALDLAGDDIGEELENLADQLGVTADRLSAHLERWAEANSEELEAWSEKYSRQWESWGERFGKKIERLADDQEDVWGRWAQGYEKDLERWAERLESADGLAPDQLGDFVEQNIKSLSKMPLGQLVDQALNDGLGELSEAPWESLEELGVLAKGAFEEPLAELTEALQENSDERRAIERGAKSLGQAAEQLKTDLGRNISDDRPGREVRIRDQRPRDSLEDARISALKKLRQRSDLSPQQVDQIDVAIKTIEDMISTRLHQQRADGTRDRIAVPDRDQFRAKIEREKQRHADTLQQFNDDLRKSSNEVRREKQRAIDRRMRVKDARSDKGIEGNNLRGDQSKSARARKNAGQPFQRDGRDGKANRKPIATKQPTSQIEKSDLELLRKEIARLRKEVQQLKNDK